MPSSSVNSTLLIATILVVAVAESVGVVSLEGAVRLSCKVTVGGLVITVTLVAVVADWLALLTALTVMVVVPSGRRGVVKENAVPESSAGSQVAPLVRENSTEEILPCSIEVDPVTGICALFVGLGRIGLRETEGTYIFAEVLLEEEDEELEGEDEPEEDSAEDPSFSGAGVFVGCPGAVVAVGGRGVAVGCPGALVAVGCWGTGVFVG